MTTNFFSEREIQKLNIPPYINANHPVAKYLLSLGKMARHGAKGRLDTMVKMFAPYETIWSFHWSVSATDVEQLVQALTNSDNTFGKHLSQKSIDKHISTLEGLLQLMNQKIAPDTEFDGVSIHDPDVFAPMLATCDKDIRYGKKIGVRDAAIIVALVAGFTFAEVAELHQADYKIERHYLKNRTLSRDAHARIVCWLNTRSGIKSKSLFLAFSIYGDLSNQSLHEQDIIHIVNSRLQKAGLA